MCRIDGADRSEVFIETTRRARKEHKCWECRRMIKPGEAYTSVFAVTEGDPSHMKTCAHCGVAQAWLVSNCEGYIYGEVREDIQEHAQEYPRLAWPLYRVAAGMRRKWLTVSGALMPLPKMPPPIAKTLAS